MLAAACRHALRDMKGFRAPRKGSQHLAPGRGFLS
jgi:hypothetical protein